ncbi:MAG TPA: hypothetical protein VII75_06400 [Thermoanaerobaculia bacterium]|nr:hypothetical protein [Thermoanaerobaculia bacterium]
MTALRVTARLLRAGKSIDWLSFALLLIAVWKRDPVAGALGLVARYFAFRVAFDAHVFDDLAEGRMTIEEFDDCGLVPPKKRGRPVADRCRGAMRLITILGILTAAQAIVLIVNQ